MNNTKLLLNIVIDNGSSMKGEKIEKIKTALKKFDDVLTSSLLQDRVEYSISIFKGFNVSIFKSFDNKLSIEEFYVGGIPFINDILLKSIENLQKRVEELESTNIDLYKPWTILLLNGENYDSLDESCDLILKLMKSSKMSYFPFALTDNQFDKSLTILRKIKPFTIIKDQKYDELFNWILNTAKSRVEKTKNEAVQINLNSFEGWTIK